MSFFDPVALGTPLGVFQTQAQLLSVTNPGSLLILHIGSPICPWDKPRLKGSRKGLRTKSLCVLSLTNMSESGRGPFAPRITWMGAARSQDWTQAKLWTLPPQR